MPPLVEIRVNLPDFKILNRILQNPTVMWTAIGARFMELFNRNWETQGLLWGKWAPIARSTAFAKGPGPPLRGTQLRQSFRVQPMRDGLRFGSPLKHAAYHQDGRKGPWDIFPKNRKALSFPWPFGASIASGGRAHITRSGASGFYVGRGKTARKIHFASPANAKMSMKALGQGKRGVFSHVVHPGYPARPMLPGQVEAERITREAAAAFIKWMLK